MDAIKYFEEKTRMINSLGGIAGDCICVSCDDCPLSVDNNGMGYRCNSLEAVYPEKAVAIVEKWSEEHPQKTMLTEFLEKYPNANLDFNGIPMICNRHLDTTRNIMCDSNCVACWNEPLED